MMILSIRKIKPKAVKPEQGRKALRLSDVVNRGAGYTNEAKSKRSSWSDTRHRTPTRTSKQKDATLHDVMQTPVSKYSERLVCDGVNIFLS